MIKEEEEEEEEKKYIYKNFLKKTLNERQTKNKRKKCNMKFKIEEKK